MCVGSYSEASSLICISAPTPEINPNLFQCSGFLSTENSQLEGSDSWEACLEKLSDSRKKFNVLFRCLYNSLRRLHGILKWILNQMMLTGSNWKNNKVNERHLIRSEVDY